jgi:hypothetical protein
MDPPASSLEDPMPYEPPPAALCAFFALAALPLAAAARQLDPAHRGSPVPRAWGAPRTLAWALGLAAAVPALALLGWPLEGAAGLLAAAAAVGGAVSDPATWYGAAAQLVAWTGRLGWQGLMVAGPLLVALAVVVERPALRGLAGALAAAAALPVPAAGVVAAIGPSPGPAPALAGALLLGLVPVGVAALVTARGGRRGGGSAPTLVSPVPWLIAEVGRLRTLEVPVEIVSSRTPAPAAAPPRRGRP